MGWQISEEWGRGHEGWLAGFVHKENAPSLLRELGYPDDSRERTDVCALAAACECGWRSPHFRPRYTIGGPICEWSPFIVHAAASDEDKARLLWAAHVQSHRPRQSRAEEDCGCRETYPQLIPGRRSHHPDCSNATRAASR